MTGNEIASIVITIIVVLYLPMKYVLLPMFVRWQNSKDGVEEDE